MKINSIIPVKGFFLLITIFFLFLDFSCKNDDSKQTVTLPSEKTTKNNDVLDENMPRTTDFDRREDRVIWQKPEMVMQKLGDMKGKTVADIGAGTGYFAFRMITKVKKVIAIDIDKKAISFMDSIKVQLPVELQPRFEARLAEAQDPKLAANEADNIIIINTYTYLKNRVEYLKNLANGMKYGGKILIIDFKKLKTPIGPDINARIDMKTVADDLNKAGYHTIITDEHSLDYQYIVSAIKL